MRLLRKLLGLLALVGVAVGAAVVARRRLTGPDERVDLYFFDGSMSSFDADSPDAAAMLTLARDALDAARGA